MKGRPKINPKMCPVPGCPRTVKGGGVMCGTHWELVPKRQRNQLLASWKSGASGRIAASPEDLARSLARVSAGLSGEAERRELGPKYALGQTIFFPAAKVAGEVLAIYQNFYAALRTRVIPLEWWSQQAVPPSTHHQLFYAIDAADNSLYLVGELDAMEVEEDDG